MAAAVGIERLGRIAIDSTTVRANASPEAVVKQEEYAALRQELERIQAEVARIDALEEAEAAPVRPKPAKPCGPNTCATFCGECAASSAKLGASADPAGRG